VIPSFLTAKLIAWAAAAALVVTGVLWLRHDAVQQEQHRVQLETMEESARLLKRSSAATETALNARVANKQRIQTVTKEIVREVIVRIPADACPLPDEWRVLHDAAATGTAPAAPGGPDGAPTGAQEAADTVAENYGQYHDVADQLRQLQQWVREVSQP
jgi:hypothetical protein